MGLVWVPPRAVPGDAVVKNPCASAGGARDMSSIPGLERSPGVGNGTLHQYSSLENSMGRGVWQAPCGHKESDMTEQLTVSLSFKVRQL